MILGIQDPWVVVAFLLCIFSALLCVGWGVVKWNADGGPAESDDTVRKWATEEDKVEDEL